MKFAEQAVVTSVLATVSMPRSVELGRQAGASRLVAAARRAVDESFCMIWGGFPHYVSSKLDSSGS